jgi:hypothetical protein
MRELRAAASSFLMLATSIALGPSALAQDLSRLPRDHPEIRVVTTAGDTTTGVLRRFDANTVTLDLDGHDRVFEKTSIARIYRDDPLKNGMLAGLASGLVVGAVTALAWCDVPSSGTGSCSGGELYFAFAFLGPVFGGAGLGIGAAIDALVHRENLLFSAPAAAAPGTSPITLQVDRGAARVAVHIRW